MDPNLIDLARCGNREALEALLGRHVRTIHRELHRCIPRRWQAMLSADDVLQVTCTDAFVAIASLTATDEATFAAWLRRMALNNLRDARRYLEAERRGGNSHRVDPTPTDAQTFVAHLFGVDSATASRIAIRRETERALETALKKLPQHYEAAIRLYDLEGRTIEHVARELGRSPGAVHLLRKRAHDRLREMLVRAASPSE